MGEHYNLTKAMVEINVSGGYHFDGSQYCVASEPPAMWPKLTACGGLGLTALALAPQWELYVQTMHYTV